MEQPSAKQDSQGAAPTPWSLARPLTWFSHPQASVAGLFALAVLYSLYFAKPVLVPIALALLIAWALRPMVRLLVAIRLPQGIAAALVVAALFASIAGATYLLADPAVRWAENAPQTLRDVELKLAHVKRSLESVQRATEKIDDITRSESAGAPPVQNAERRPLSEILLTSTQIFAFSALTTVVLAYFLLASGDRLMLRTIRSTQSAAKRKRLVDIVRRIENDIGRYLATITAINVVLGAVTAQAMALLDMPNPLLWGAMVALLNFIPYVGSAIAIFILSIVAILHFDTLGQALIPPLVFFVLTTAEGQILSPIVLGKRFSVNPIFVFVSLLFWGWLWGVVGMFMAVPLLVIAKIVVSEIERPYDEAVAMDMEGGQT